MPRQARLDAPHTLHHVMVRGLERRAIFRDDADGADFVGRLAALAEAGALTVLAWACLPNHAHLLVRTGTLPLARNINPSSPRLAGGLQSPPPASRAPLPEPVQVGRGGGRSVPPGAATSIIMPAIPISLISFEQRLLVC